MNLTHRLLYSDHPRRKSAKMRSKAHRLPVRGLYAVLELMVFEAWRWGECAIVSTVYPWCIVGENEIVWVFLEDRKVSMGVLLSDLIAVEARLSDMLPDTMDI